MVTIANKLHDLYNLFNQEKPSAVSKKSHIDQEEDDIRTKRAQVFIT